MFHASFQFQWEMKKNGLHFAHSDAKTKARPNASNNAITERKNIEEKAGNKTLRPAERKRE